MNKLPRNNEVTVDKTKYKLTMYNAREGQKFEQKWKIRLHIARIEDLKQQLINPKLSDSVKKDVFRKKLEIENDLHKVERELSISKMLLILRGNNGMNEEYLWNLDNDHFQKLELECAMFEFGLSDLNYSILERIKFELQKLGTNPISPTTIISKIEELEQQVLTGEFKKNSTTSV